MWSWKANYDNTERSCPQRCQIWFDFKRGREDTGNESEWAWGQCWQRNRNATLSKPLSTSVSVGVWPQTTPSPLVSLDTHSYTHDSPSNIPPTSHSQLHTLASFHNSTTQIATDNKVLPESTTRLYFAYWSGRTVELSSRGLYMWYSLRINGSINH